MNRQRLQKLIALTASLSKGDPLRRKVVEMLVSADDDTKKFAQSMFDQQKQLQARLNTPANVPDELETRLLALPDAKAKPPRATNIKKYYWFMASAAAVLLAAVLAFAFLKHQKFLQKISVAAQIAALQHVPLKSSLPNMPARVAAAAARLKFAFTPVVPAYPGFQLVGYSVAKVVGQPGLVTYWRSEFGQPCTLVQLPQKFARQLAIRRPTVLHVRDATGTITATVTIWEDSTAHCSWAEVLSGDTNFYRPGLLLHGRPI
jgi:hypothetical protein